MTTDTPSDDAASDEPVNGSRRFPRLNWKAVAVVGGVIGLVSSCAIGSQFGAWATDPETLTATETYPVFVDAWVTETPDPIIRTEMAQVTVTAAPPAAETPDEPTKVGAGVWVVGVDIPAGTYRTELEVSDRCYWEINPSAGSDEILQNDIPGGGRPTVDLVDGQQFSSDKCNQWVKQ